MQFGIALFPLRASQYHDVAVNAEELGFESLWLGEHLVTPWDFKSRYPYEHPLVKAGEAFYRPDLPFYDPFAVLGYMAAVTSRIKLATSVCIVPLHDPFHLARSVASLDLLSNGRFLFGTGAGWCKEEFDLAGKSWDGRGKRYDESLEVMVRLWNDERASFQGQWFDVPPSGFEPKPLTRPHPPFIIGGSSEAALRRAARIGDGWYGSGYQIGSEPLDRLRNVTARLDHLLEDYGRSDVPFSRTVRVHAVPDDGVQADLAEIGIDRVIIRPWTKGSQSVDGLRQAAQDLGLARFTT